MPKNQMIVDSCGTHTIFTSFCRNCLVFTFITDFRLQVPLTQFLRSLYWPCLFCRTRSVRHLPWLPSGAECPWIGVVRLVCLFNPLEWWSRRLAARRGAKSCHRANLDRILQLSRNERCDQTRPQLPHASLSCITDGPSARRQPPDRAAFFRALEFELWQAWPLTVPWRWFAASDLAVFFCGENACLCVEAGNLRRTGWGMTRFLDVLAFDKWHPSSFQFQVVTWCFHTADQSLIVDKGLSFLLSILV